MDKYKKLRWAVLLSTLAATVGAIFYPADESAPSMIARTAKPITAVRTVPASAPREQGRGRPIWVASDQNPFAPRVWEAAPPPAEVARAVQPVELAQAAPEPPPTPLPYRFLGQMQDGTNHVLYLGHGEQVLLARQGDVLEGSYKVVAVSDGMIEFESVQSGIKQTLPIPAQ